MVPPSTKRPANAAAPTGNIEGYSSLSLVALLGLGALLLALPDFPASRYYVPYSEIPVIAVAFGLGVGGARRGRGGGRVAACLSLAALTALLAYAFVIQWGEVRRYWGF